MSKKVKRIISLVITVFSVINLLPIAAAAEEVNMKSINDDMEYIISDENLIKINKADLFEDEKYISEVYVICLSGSDFSLGKGSINSLFTCLRSSFSLNNPYLEELKKNVCDIIPEKSKIILIGHSLGGMIAQQFSGDKDMQEKYEILNIVCIGAPYIVLKNKEGNLCRLGDSGDAVPFLGPLGLLNGFFGNFSRENTGYFGNPGGAHFDSYKAARKWGCYDCLGTKDGKASITIKSLYDADSSKADF